MPPDHLARFRRLAIALDARWRVPGTPVRFGWDALLGLLPGVGDALGGLLGGYGLFVATRLGAPGVVLARMLLNLVIDVSVGTIPLFGDVFDVGWAGNLRNLSLLERWLAQPHRTRRQSWALFGLVALALAGVGIAVVLTLVRVLKWLRG
jgi:hypothetical protein